MRGRVCRSMPCACYGIPCPELDVSLLSAIAANRPRAICAACGITAASPGTAPAPVFQAGAAVHACALAWLQTPNCINLAKLHYACHVWHASMRACADSSTAAPTLLKTNKPARRASGPVLPYVAAPEPMKREIRRAPHGSIDVCRVIGINPRDFASVTESRYPDIPGSIPTIAEEAELFATVDRAAFDTAARKRSESAARADQLARAARVAAPAIAEHQAIVSAHEAAVTAEHALETFLRPSSKSPVTAPPTKQAKRIASL